MFGFSQVMFPVVVTGGGLQPSLAKRLMTLLPLNERQKSFRTNDGISHNSVNIQAIFEYHMGNLEPTCSTFLDVKKASDSVDHDTIQLV